MESSQVTAEVKVDPSQGLAQSEAAARLRVYGPNRPSVPPGKSAWRRFAAQVAQPLVLVLIAAGTVTVFLGEWLDAGVIFAVVLINAILGFVQEGKAAAALAALAQAVAAEATVLRAGSHQRLDAAALVPGDLVLLASGDKVPADMRLLTSKELRTSEAALTGESLPVDKCSDCLAADTPLAERRNMAYAGTLVVAGQGRAVVVATGNGTESGRICALIAQAPELTTPLTRKMAVFAQQLLIAILLLAALTFGVGVLRGESAFSMFMAAVALAVGAIPEGLPAAMTITLAIGVARMAKRRAIIRKLPAVETLGSTTVICSDKTGTLTENAMTVRAIWAGGEAFSVSGHGYGPTGRIEWAGQPVAIAAALRETLLASALCNDARVLHSGQHWTVVGDPTEAALLVAARKGGLDTQTLNSIFPRLDELPFDSTRQYMATLHEIEGARIVCVKGAVEKLLASCASMLDAHGHEVPLTAETVHAEATRLAASGLRVLAVARSELAPGQRLEHARLGAELVFLGLMAMLDPPRPRAIRAVRTCQAAGIRVKMITGDHPSTASAIARQLGIVRAGVAAWTGQELAKLDDQALRRVAADVDVFARVEPEQKLRLVRALQAGGEVVAMTGDGVNDAPALKQADIGIAMGQGTEVAKEAAAMILTDDNFATIEAAIEEGRGLYDNLVKFIAWTIPTNASEGLVILAAVFAGTPLPITPLQILWINLTTAILLGMMLAFEPAERGIMQRPPRTPGAPVLDRGLLQRIVLLSLLMLAGAFGLFELALQRGQSMAQARTVATNVFVLVAIVYLFNCRSLSHPFWSMAAFSNPWVWFGSAAMLALQLAFTYLPACNRVFHSAPIGLREWLWIGAFAATCALIIEAQKYLGSARQTASQARPGSRAE
ncbi:HAD-IC family P-type ATPase [Pseudomonas sp.]|uniref:cation-translocating P-type ATPase n=1 Tax=Pseudomonas sp. TaxID=306 RepID=UPI002735D558|nr:HAD-IC family P-type ATPase [Pseudomonas sp.]MDP3813791.1 HAD-IC family P-type ATPase [Pseudomonas sp.]